MIGLRRKSPFYFNLSLSVGDDENIVHENREAFFHQFGLSSDKIAFQKQSHSNIVTIVQSPGVCVESDSMITDRENLGLVISAADCTSVYVYDFKLRIIAAIHSGWRGTKANIVDKTLNIIFNEFNSKPENLFAYIGPSISQANYEVGKEVAEQFDGKYLKYNNNKFYLDVAGANYDMLINNGIKPAHIQKSGLCTYEFNELLHSYRRDGIKSGRSLGIIAIKS
ncbi:peptidoglycan editing factor PgeF [Ignavibacterium sp.]|uniref:peptidoglycan editing factor PgeF n=1 Tax=Ignavibacterium sp. TaxID=2651167 RepID=UPI00307D8532